MDLYDDVEKIFSRFIGTSSADVLKQLSNSKNYPKDFLEEGADFISHIVGKNESSKIFKKIAKRHNLTLN